MLPLIRLPIGWTVVLDSAVWAVIQPLIGFLCTQLPPSAFDAGHWLFRTRRWEQGGAIYERLFRVRRWKGWLPSGGTVFRGGFSMRRVMSSRREYLERYLQETCRAELTHWLALGASVLFFLWNPPWLGLYMVLYAVVVNAPCIVVQRANRPHILRIMARSGRVRGDEQPAAA